MWAQDTHGARPNFTSTLYVYKNNPDEKLGVSFFEDSDAVRVKFVKPGSLAAASGLQLDDILLAINNVACEDGLGAAKALRESNGEVELTVERSLHYVAVPGDGSDAESLTLSPPRLHSDNATKEEEDVEYDEASADEWDEWLCWMISRIRAREEELTDMQTKTAEQLAQSMGSGESQGEEQPPSPPNEAAMNDPAIMEEYMMRLGEYACRQKERLYGDGRDGVDHSALMEENQEATAALALLVARREELERYHSNVDGLTEEDAARIEKIWRELASEEDGDGEEETEEDGEDDDAEFYDDEEEVVPSGEEAAAAEVQRLLRGAAADEEVECILVGASHKPKPAKEAAQTSLISPVLRSLNAVDVNSGLSGRVVSEKAKGNKLEQRLQRARSSKKLLGGGIKGSLVDPWMSEVGVKIYPC